MLERATLRLNVYAKRAEHLEVAKQFDIASLLVEQAFANGEAH
jgi:hypothetical protein